MAEKDKSETETNGGCSMDGEDYVWEINKGEDTIVKGRIPAKAANAYKEFVENTPDVEATLLHISTLPNLQDRYRLLVEWKRPMKYDSNLYPLEAEWFMAVELPKRKPSKAVLWWQKRGLQQLGMTLFSYNDEDDGLLRRHQFAILVDPNSKRAGRIALNFHRLITDNGGISSVVSVPEIRWNCINLVIGTPKRSWANFFVPLFTVDMVSHVIKTGRFNSAEMRKFRLPNQRPLSLNMFYLMRFM